MTRKAMTRTEEARGWAWEIREGEGWVLCYWLVKRKSELTQEFKPSTEARAVRVVMRKVADKQARRRGKEVR